MDATHVMRQGIFDRNSEEYKSMKDAYGQSEPYPHCIIKDFCDDAILRRVREEIIENFDATYKETDLFKMLQTVDLANLNALDDEKKKKIPNLLALRDAIYSKEFREFVSEITGCGELSDTTDCACNIHPVGGHLLCHDDVIGDRRVSYIIYLTDPDKGWSEEDGGALELYPEDPEAPQVPYPIPTATALPIWNTMAMFKVQPGKSFHSIQEVMTNEKPRMSLQGWFHGPLPDKEENAALPTLQMLQSRGGGDKGNSVKDYNEFMPVSGTERVVGDDEPYTISAQDAEYLKQWINPMYLDGRGTAKIQEKFASDGSIHLINILNEETAEKVQKDMLQIDAEDGVGHGKRPAYDAGMKDGWTLRGPAHMQRYLEFTGDSSTQESTHRRLGSTMRELCDKVICSVPFANLIRSFTTLTMDGVNRREIRRFRPGLDYTVAHYGILTKDPRLDVVLTFVDEASMDESSWADGECGGFEAYLLADEEEDGPAEVYRQAQDDESGVLNISAAFNAISIVLRDEGLMRFVKYVASSAPGSRWDVSVECVPQDDSDDDEEE
ncbi:hypothetical protein M9435_005366 [Picochlorum sp. BPE23]|nr:hypothetical protein M9435_005366 [Picochlorum sp. BPE23]